MIEKQWNSFEYRLVNKYDSYTHAVLYCDRCRVCIRNRYMLKMKYILLYCVPAPHERTSVTVQNNRRVHAHFIWYVEKGKKNETRAEVTMSRSEKSLARNPR